MGAGPVGFDLAHVVLSAFGQLWPGDSIADVHNALLDAYVTGLGCEEDPLRFATAASAALVGVSRLCWTLRRTADPSVVDYWSAVADWISVAGQL